MGRKAARTPSIMSVSKIADAPVESDERLPLGMSGENRWQSMPVGISTTLRLCCRHHCAIVEFPAITPVARRTSRAVILSPNGSESHTRAQYPKRTVASPGHRGSRPGTNCRSSQVRSEPNWRSSAGVREQHVKQHLRKRHRKRCTHIYPAKAPGKRGVINRRARFVNLNTVSKQLCEVLTEWNRAAGASRPLVTARTVRL